MYAWHDSCSNDVWSNDDSTNDNSLKRDLFERLKSETTFVRKVKSQKRNKSEKLFIRNETISKGHLSEWLFVRRDISSKRHLSEILWAWLRDSILHRASPVIHIRAGWFWNRLKNISYLAAPPTSYTLGQGDLGTEWRIFHIWRLLPRRTH